MNFEFKQVSKRFQYQWILKDIDLKIESGEHIGIRGRNGSGKSTLLKILTSIIPPSEGEILYSMGDRRINSQDLYRYYSLTAPYLDLIEDFNLSQCIKLHTSLKPLINDMSVDDVLKILDLEVHSEKEIKYFSSGMYQRVKLCLSVLSQSECIFLDEPTSNLDSEAEVWYHSLINNYVGDRTLVIASNVVDDFRECDTIYHIEEGNLLN